MLVSQASKTPCVYLFDKLKRLGYKWKINSATAYGMLPPLLDIRRASRVSSLRPGRNLDRSCSNLALGSTLHDAIPV
ncbi:hypothetical protein WN55_00423 [Dufourea novaeangliae]|uniref:Uncharacterized protein n=1 Tax=Dufourea novaeangliae TaxID=178035 RepID=A0A154PFQ4_DUFNO|nr:hypothetical protein WN55_00423 [Dufourea novaeangliae]